MATLFFHQMFNFLLLKLEYCSLQDKTWGTYHAASGSTVITEKLKNRQIDKLFKINMDISSIQFSLSVVSDSLQLHGLQHARPPGPSPTPGIYSHLCPLNQWCHPTISSSVVPFCCLQSFPASGSFLMSWLFAAGGHSIGDSASASASVLPMNIQDWFPLGLTGLISLQFKGLSRVFSNTTVQKHQFFSTHPSLVQLSIPSLATGKTVTLAYTDLCWQSNVSVF